jgi:hypothetical protein
MVEANAWAKYILKSADILVCAAAKRTLSYGLASISI